MIELSARAQRRLAQFASAEVARTRLNEVERRADEVADQIARLESEQYHLEKEGDDLGEIIPYLEVIEANPELVVWDSPSD